MSPGHPLGACAARGAWALRANPRLVAVTVLESLLVGGLTVMGALLPIFALLGTHSLSDLAALGQIRDVEMAADFYLAIGSHFSAERVLKGSLGAIALWSVATLLWVYLEGVRWGGVAAADARGQHRCRGSFEVASWTALLGWGRRYFGRFFLFLNGYAVVISLVVLAAVLCLAWAVRGGAVGKVLGAAGILLMILLSFLLHLGFGVGRALLARPGGTMTNASRGAVQVLRHRPLAVAGLAVVAVGASLTVSALVSAGTEIVRLFGAEFGMAGWILQMLAQIVLGSCIAVWHGGALAALSAWAASGAMPAAKISRAGVAVGEAS
ncbi:MAG: hypothetical protein AAF481_00065 [Acidobacteriota bacterium]